MTEPAIAAAYRQLCEDVGNIAAKSGRSAGEIGILLVTKTVLPERIRQAVECGARDFGENRVQELLSKQEDLPENLNWHFIGHLQTNKVRQVLGKVKLIHSLDREDLLKELEKQAAKQKIAEVPCLIQVNASGEETKGGLAPGDVAGFAATVGKDSPVKIKGLMTIGPFTEDEAKIRECFRSVFRLKEELKDKQPGHDWGILSMGMSADYKIAIEEGSTLIRVGSAVFGARPAVNQ